MAKLKSRTREEWIASRRYNIQDAKEALRAAISMSDWRGARKYIAQLERLERQLHDAERGASWIHGPTVRYTSGGARATHSTRRRV